MLGRMRKALYRGPAALYRAAVTSYNREGSGDLLQNRRNLPMSAI